MLDDPEQTERLLVALKAAVPLERGPAAVEDAREGGSNWVTRQIAQNISHLGDMSDIVCHL
jgi:hypothetical protein